jgi:hypothetical protein
MGHKHGLWIDNWYNEFVCEKLEAFATDGQTHHKRAVERLKQIAISP